MKKETARRNEQCLNGELYEAMAVGYFEDREILAERVSEFQAHDLEIDGICVEVKGSVLQDFGNYTRGYQFLIHRAGKGPHAPSDFHALFCLVDDKTLHAFIIPSEQIEGMSMVKIPNPDPTRYRGKYSPYLNRIGYFKKGRRSNGR